MSVKLHEAVCFDSLQDRLFFFDDFHGDQLQDEWFEGGTGSAAVVDAETGGIVRITTGAITNDAYYISWNNIRSLHVSKRVSAEFRVKINADTNCRIFIAIFHDGDNRIRFYADNAGAADDWEIWCENGGAITRQESGITLDTDYHIFRIECHLHGGSHVHFYIDGVETANSPITTNIPDDVGDYLQPYLVIITTEDVAKSMDTDYIYARQER